MRPVRIVDIKPYDWGKILAASRGEGYGIPTRLVSDFSESTNRFDQPGEALFAQLRGNVVIGVAGLNRENAAKFQEAGRVRRVYVMPEVRGSGIGRMLLQEVLVWAETRFNSLTVNVGNLEVGGFYEKLGFVPVVETGITHVKRWST